MLFIEVSILSDLHRLAAARTSIAVAGDDERLLSLALRPQCAPRAILHERPQNASVRENKQS
jgi:hypothetical protein